AKLLNTTLTKPAKVADKPKTPVQKGTHQITMYILKIRSTAASSKLPHKGKPKIAIKTKSQLKRLGTSTSKSGISPAASWAKTSGSPNLATASASLKPSSIKSKIISS